MRLSRTLIFKIRTSDNPLNTMGFSIKGTKTPISVSVILKFFVILFLTKGEGACGGSLWCLPQCPKQAGE